MAMLIFAIGLFCISTGRVRAGNIQGMVLNNTLTLGYFVTWEVGAIIGPYVGSAIDVGIREVYHRDILPGYEIEWVFRDDHGEPRQGMQAAVDIWSSVEDLDGFIGPMCGAVVKPVSLLSTAWGIPVISWGSTSQALTNKDIYPMYTSMSDTFASRSPVFDHICAVFGWKRIGIICNQNEPFKSQGVALLKQIRHNNREAEIQVVKRTWRGDQIDTAALEALKRVMEYMKSRVHILIVLGNAIDLRNMLITALDLDMMNGEYAFIANFPPAVHALRNKHDYRPEADEFIYNGLLVVEHHIDSSPQYDTFRKNVIDAFQEPQFDHLPPLLPNASIDDVRPHAGMIILLVCTSICSKLIMLIDIMLYYTLF